MKFSPSNSHDRECLLAVTARVPLAAVHDSMFSPAHAAQDDMGEWAAANAESLQLGLADARLQQLADEERAKLLRESLSRFGQSAGCNGDCCDGVTPADCTCGHAMAWRAQRQQRITPRRRSRWARVLRDLVRWLRSPRSGFGWL